MSTPPLRFEGQKYGKTIASAGVAKWLKAQGLGPCHEGVRGFDSRPPHIEIILLISVSLYNCFN